MATPWKRTGELFESSLNTFWSLLDLLESSLCGRLPATRESESALQLVSTPRNVCHPGAVLHLMLRSMWDFFPNAWRAFRRRPLSPMSQFYQCSYAVRWNICRNSTIYWFNDDDAEYENERRISWMFLNCLQSQCNPALIAEMNCLAILQNTHSTEARLKTTSSHRRSTVHKIIASSFVEVRMRASLWKTLKSNLKYESDVNCRWESLLKKRSACMQRLYSCCLGHSDEAPNSLQMNRDPLHTSIVLPRHYKRRAQREMPNRYKNCEKKNTMPSSGTLPFSIRSRTIWPESRSLRPWLLLFWQRFKL